MSFDYDEYLRLCDKEREKNQKYVDLFEIEMIDQGLKDNTIRKHLYNIEFYINEYLLREDIKPMQSGCYETDMFLGYFFIRKCMWSSPTGIKDNIASFKKFYKCMLNNGHITEEDYNCLLDTISDHKDEWIQCCKEYNDPSYENPFEREMREFFGDF